MRRIAVLTSGGDAPGMNACLWALAHEAAGRGWTTVGVRDSYPGLLAADGGPFSPAEAQRFARYGGTWLGAARLPDLPQRVPAVLDGLARLGCDGLVVIGGGGSLAGCGLLAAAGAAVVGIPATIDNDIAGSEMTLGYDTALNTGVEIADRIADTAEAMPRLFALETLGGSTGFLARAIASLVGADAALVPERAVDINAVADRVRTGMAARRYGFIVASEGVPALPATLQAVADAVDTRLRFSRLGHAQRGGRPTARDRGLARAFASAAIAMLADGESGWTPVVEGRVARAGLPPPALVRELPDDTWLEI